MNKFLLIIIIVATILSCSSNSLFGQKKAVLYAYKFNSFTKIPITEKSIKDGYSFIKKINGNVFFEKIDSLFEKKIPLTEDSIISNQIRIYIHSCRRNLVISKDLYLKYENKYYVLDKEMLQIILEYIPIEDRKLYTPIGFR